MMRILLLALSSLALLAGCADNASAHGAASLDFNGTGMGTHDDSAECDDDGTVTGTGNVDDGTLHVTVTDGDGKVQFDETYDGGVDASAEHMDGASGTWTLTATRVGDDLLGDEFKGQYEFTLAC